MIYHVDDWVLDAARRELRRNGVLRPIEPQVFDLLEFLIRNRDRVLSRDDIFAAVWHGRIVSDATLSTRINAARQAIGDDGDAQRLIKTFYRIGFRFVGTVREEHRVSDAPPRIGPSKRRLSQTFDDVPAIVMLPFTTIGPEPDRQQFADGLAEEVTTALSRLDWLAVVSQRSWDKSAGEPIDLRHMARKVRARYLLQGSVRHAGGRTRVTVQLVDSATGHHLAAERYDHDAADAFQAQDDIAERVVSTVSDQIFLAEDRRAQCQSPQSLGAWGCIVRALALMNTRKKQHVAAAHALLRTAIGIDPKSAPAYSLLSFVITLGVHLGWSSRKKVQAAALQYAQKALALDSDEPWAHVALGYATLQICNQPEQAIEMLEYGLRLDPNLAIAHYFIALASCYASDGDKGFRHADMAERLKPFDLLARGNAGAHDNVRATASFVTGRYGQGIDFARKAIAQSPRQVPAYRLVVLNSAMDGQIKQAAAALQYIKRTAPDIKQWLEESSSVWNRREDYEKYVEGFRIAGFK